MARESIQRKGNWETIPSLGDYTHLPADPKRPLKHVCFTKGHCSKGKKTYTTNRSRQYFNMEQKLDTWMDVMSYS